MLTIEELLQLCSDPDNVIITQHGFKRLRNRGITVADLLSGIKSGEIIEQYPDDYPYPSCLVLGITVNNEHIHIVCGVGDNKLWIISSYLPALDRWEADYKTRKAAEK